MVNDVYSFQRALDQAGVANVTLYKLGVRIEVLWTSVPMDLLHDRVQNSDTMTLRHQCIDNMRADETGAPCDKNVLQFKIPSNDLCGPLRISAISALKVT